MNIKSIISQQNWNLVSDRIKADIQHLVNIISIIEKEYGKNFEVTSGFRTKEDQQRINPRAMQSAHMSGKAVDIYDPHGALDEWLCTRQDLLEKYALWQEHPSATATWCHLDTKCREVKERQDCLKRQFKP
jgi:hypothetical protein